MVDKIAILDDSDFDVDVMKIGIKRYSDFSHPFIAFGDPDELFTFLDRVKAGEEDCPALILVDVNLGIMSGHEVLEKIHQDPYFRDAPPVIVISHSKSADDIKQAMEHGAAGYQIKPATADEFREFCAFITDVINKAGNPD